MSGRVVVELHLARGRGACLQGALELAARLEGELLGLFVMDERVLRSAALPFVRQVGRFSAEEEDFDPPRAERELKALAERARRELAERAAARRVGWSFEVLRGAARSSSAAPQADIVVVAGPARAAPPGFAGCSVLSLRAHRGLGQPLVLAPAEAPAADATLALATRLADAAHPVVVLLPSADPGLLQARLQPILDERRTPLRVVALEHPTPATIARAARDARAGLLVLSTGAIPDDFERLLDALDLPLLVVASPPPS